MSYNERVRFITEKANLMKKAIFLPILDDVSGEFIGDRKMCQDRLEQETPHSIFEAAGKGARMIQATAANALRSYCNHYGHLPSDELLASAFQGIENAINVTSAKTRNNFDGLILEAADMQTTEGVIMRDRMVALIMPVMLNMVTSNLVSHIPGTFNQSEIFKIWRVAASNFADMTIGDKIDYNYNKQYSSMDQRHAVASGDGTDVGGAGSTTPNYFAFDTNTQFGAVHPMKKKSIKIYHDRNLVAADDGAGNLQGTFDPGSGAVTVSGAVNYATGNINPVFSTAPANGIEIHVSFDVDIEKDPTLIPLVSTEMDSKVIYPHEAAIAANTTLQALWAIRREFDLNADSMAMAAMRNLLAADKDRKILRDLYFFAKNEVSWVYVAGSGLHPHEYFETVLGSLLEVDQALMQANGAAGLSGLVADDKSATIFKSLRQPHFTPVPGYQRKPQPHYCGKLFGRWDLYEDPQGNSYESLCYAKGPGVGEAGYVAGDAVPALTFKHAMQRDLNYKNTLWELAYRDLNPFNGRDFFTTLKMTAS